MKISIIGAFYNVSEYVDRAFQSILNQTFIDWEFIAIDDDSKDDTYKKIRKYELKDSRIKTIKLKNNSGLSEVRNYGMKLAKGDYILFLDGDDYFSDRLFFSQLMEFADKGNYDWINFYFSLDYSSGKKRVRKVDSTIKNMYSGVWNKLYKRTIIKELSFPVGKRFEDVAFSIQAYQMAEKKATLPVVGYNYWQRTNSIVREKRADQAHSDVADILLEAIKNNKIFLSKEVVTYVINQLFNHYIVMIGDNHFDKKYIRKRHLDTFSNIINFLLQRTNQFISKKSLTELKFLKHISENGTNLFDKVIIKIILIGRNAVR